jgi:hypothetical protein
MYLSQNNSILGVTPRLVFLLILNQQRRRCCAITTSTASPYLWQAQRSATTTSILISYGAAGYMVTPLAIPICSAKVPRYPTTR